MKAMILAAGKGTRVRPLTYVVPKPMIPLLGRPVMEFLIDHLRTYGFDEIVINTSYLADQIQDYFRDGSRFDVQIAYSFEGELAADGSMRDVALGSAGGLRRIQDFSGFFDETFVVMCGDALVDVDLGAALRFHRRSGAMATIVVKEVAPEDVSSYGIVVTDEYGRIRSFQEKPAPTEALSRTANTGIYIFEPSVFAHIPPGETFDIGSQLFPRLLEAGAPFYAVSLPFEWVDIGRTSDFWDATMRLLRGEIASARIPGREVAPGIFTGVNVSLPQDLSRIDGPVWIGGSASIADKAVIVGPVAIGPGAVIEAGAHIEHSIIWDYTRVSAYATLRNQIVCGPYSVTSSGASISLEDTNLRWAIDDARRLQLPSDPDGIGEFVRAHSGLGGA